MNRASTTVFDAFIADGATTTYTSLEHVEGLASGRQLGFMIRARKYTNAYLTVDIETSVDGKNFQSKYVEYAALSDPTPHPLVAARHLKVIDSDPEVFADNFAVAEPSPPRPNLRFCRLAITVLNFESESASAYLKISACVRGSSAVRAASTPAPAARAAPGSLARHDEMMHELKSLSTEAQGLDPARRAAYIMRNLHPSTKGHIQAVEQRLMALPPETRRGFFETTKAMMGHALRATPKRPPPAAPEAPCCDGPPKPTPCGPCGAK
jgi:hypothetical protein